MDLSVGDGRSRRERRQLAVTVARPMSARQSSICDRRFVVRGSCGFRTVVVLDRRMVEARSMFLAHARLESVARRWALDRMRERACRQARIWFVVVVMVVVVESCGAWAVRVRPWMKRLKMGRASGTMVGWQVPVLKMVLKMWRMQACRSVCMMDGKTSAASTRALRESGMRVEVSSDVF